MDDRKKAHLDNIIGRLLVATDAEEIQSVYKDWADTYDNDLDGYGYVAPQIGAALFAEYVSNRTRFVLDAGCGTGLVGQALHDLGYKTFDGTDFSLSMLEKAETLGVYQTLFQANFFEPIDIEDEKYDGIISIGVYFSRMKEIFVPELVRTLKPGGILCFSARPQYFEAELEAQLEQHAANDLITVETIIERPYMIGQDANAHYIVLRKN